MIQRLNHSDAGQAGALNVGGDGARHERVGETG